MRVSGLVLLLLALGHLVIMHLLHNVDEISFSFVAGRYRFAFWKWYDWTLLILALIHGLNGLRMIAEDNLNGIWRSATRGLIVVILVVFGSLGSWVILTFKAP